MAERFFKKGSLTWSVELFFLLLSILRFSCLFWNKRFKFRELRRANRKTVIHWLFFLAVIVHFSKLARWFIHFSEVSDSGNQPLSNGKAEYDEVGYQWHINLIVFQNNFYHTIDWFSGDVLISNSMDTAACHKNFSDFGEFGKTYFRPATLMKTARQTAMKRKCKVFSQIKYLEAFRNC